MGVRAAGPDDFETLLARVLRKRLPPVTAWALAPAPDIVEARLAYSRWVVGRLLQIGRVWIGDDGSAAGGQRLRVPWHDQLLASPPPGGGNIGVIRGGYAYPDVPAACRERFRDATLASQQLRSLPARRTFLVQLWGAADDATTEPLDALLGYARAIGQTCYGLTSGPAGPGGSELLRRAGFRLAGEAPAGPDGRPALQGWVRPV